MKNTVNFDKEKRIVKSAEQAKTTLDMLLQDSEKQDLERGISGLLYKLQNPGLNVLLYSYPDLLQEYDLDQLLSGSLEIIGIRKQDIQTAGLLSCLVLLISLCHELKENQNPTDNRFDGLRYILSSITASRFVQELLLIVISVTGEDCFQKFEQRIEGLDFDLENAINPENDPKLREHFALMVWFVLVRLFLESVYIYFNNPFQFSPNQERIKQE